jgi:hypothetical protein
MDAKIYHILDTNADYGNETEVQKMKVKGHLHVTMF